MSQLRHWFWEIEEKRQGPDYIFQATFETSEPTQLRDLVRQQPLPCFHHDPQAQPGFWEKCAVFDCYFDEHTYHRMEEGRRQGKAENIWYGTFIEVIDDRICIQRILSGSQEPPQPMTETNLFLFLADSPLLTLTKWFIAYNGYSWGLVAEGENATSLRAYLTA